MVWVLRAIGQPTEGSRGELEQRMREYVVTLDVGALIVYALKRSTPVVLCSYTEEFANLVKGAEEERVQQSKLTLEATGTIYAWGCNSDGQLCNGTTKSTMLPVYNPQLAGKGIIRVIAVHTRIIPSCALFPPIPHWAIDRCGVLLPNLSHTGHGLHELLWHHARWSGMVLGWRSRGSDRRATGCREGKVWPRLVHSCHSRGCGRAQDGRLGATLGPAPH